MMFSQNAVFVSTSQLPGQRVKSFFSIIYFLLTLHFRPKIKKNKGVETEGAYDKRRAVGA